MRRSWALLVAGALAVPGVAHAGMSAAEAKVNQATSLVVQGRFGDAEPELRRAIALDPGEAEGHYNLGVVLRETGRFDEATSEYKKAFDLFQAHAGADGENSLAKCLYGIALAREAASDPRMAVAAWDDYIRFARPYASEQSAIEVARNHLDGEMRAANLKGPFPFGPPTATRPQNKQ